jgi:hypothetical protein
MQTQTLLLPCSSKPALNQNNRSKQEQRWVEVSKDQCSMATKEVMNSWIEKKR